MGYYNCVCEYCGWRGSSKDVVVAKDYWSDDGDIICPQCDQVFLSLGEGEVRHDPLFAAALELATRAHADQVDKAGRPYIGHPARVAARMPKDDLDGRVTALLHDVLEDTCTNMADMRAAGIPEHVIEAVRALTRDKSFDEPIEEYLARVKANPLALRVKLADVADNADEGRLGLLPNAEASRLRDKYALVRVVLQGGG